MSLVAALPPTDPRFIDMIGYKCGRLEVISYAGYVQYKKYKMHYWNCNCECGVQTTQPGSHLREGVIVSCGCYHSEKSTHRLTVHGHATSIGQSPEYRTWMYMKGRCYRENNNRYHLYGKLGVTVCERWLNSFENF